MTQWEHHGPLGLEKNTLATVIPWYVNPHNLGYNYTYIYNFYIGYNIYIWIYTLYKYGDISTYIVALLCWNHGNYEGE